jgi:cytoskeletal protein CcmA (bactofilin family)
MAMFTVVVVTATTATLTAVAFSAATATLRRADHAEVREQAIHLAEAAVARAFSSMAADANYSTTPMQLPAQKPSRSWLLTLASTAPMETAREGQYAWIVPAGADVVFGVGYVPTRAAPRATRIVRVDASVMRPLGLFNLVTAGSLTIFGNPTIAGGVHTNGDLTIDGSATIDGDATATGTYTADEDTDVGGVSGGGYEVMPIPAADPRSYRSHADVDLCPDGSVRTVVAQPCTGTVLANGSYQGWTFSSLQWRASGNSVGDGVFYVYHASVTLTGNLGPWNATILIEGESLNGTLLNGDLEVSGNIELTGDVQVEGSSQNIAFVVSRDIKISGNGFFEGLVHAGEQIELAGNSEIAGQVIASGTSSSPGSPIALNRVVGNPSFLDANNGPNVAAQIDASGWTEL